MALFDKVKPTHVVHLAALVGGLFKNMKYKVRVPPSHCAGHTSSRSKRAARAAEIRSSRTNGSGRAPFSPLSHAAHFPPRQLPHQ